MADTNGGPLVTQIQKFAVNDGPGFRTNVFLKGCSLQCKWCHNPETQSFTPEVYWKSRLCVQCGACMDACPRDAINAPIPPEEAREEGAVYHKIIRERCNNCLECVDACAYGALEAVGECMSVEEIINEVEQDSIFYSNSGGGMTITGGEPMTHQGFVEALLFAAKKKGFHVCLDTAGFCRWNELAPVVKKTDIVLYDLKHLDPLKHRELTGVDNALILQNLRNLCETGVETWLRIVVIPGYTDSPDYHQKVAEFLKGLPRGVDRIDLLPFHNWCQDKYNWLGRNWPLGTEIEALDPSEVEPLQEPYEDEGLNVTVGGSGFESDT